MTNQPALIIDGVILPVQACPEHEYTLPTAAVAAGYGVSESTIKEHKRQHANELISGKHFLEVRNPDFHPGKGGAHTHIHWTKRGIVRLGFFIRSERARRFRDMAEDLVLGRVEAPHDLAGLVDELRALRTGLLAEQRALLAGLVGELRTLRADVDDLREAQRRIEAAAAPDPVDERVATWVRGLAWAMLHQRETHVRLSMRDLLDLRPPVPAGIVSPPKWLGRRLSHLSANGVKLSPKVHAQLSPYREAHGRGWAFCLHQSQ